MGWNHQPVTVCIYFLFTLLNEAAEMFVVTWPSPAKIEILKVDWQSFNKSHCQLGAVGPMAFFFMPLLFTFVLLSQLTTLTSSLWWDFCIKSLGIDDFWWSSCIIQCSLRGRRHEVMKKDSLETQPKDPRRDIFTQRTAGWPLGWRFFPRRAYLGWKSCWEISYTCLKVAKEAAGGRS